MTDGETKPPQLLSEADLITKMDQNGIGTDATIHEHIKTVQERQYAVKQNQNFLPTPVGVSLVEAYEHLGIELYKPYLRAQMENDMKMIALGTKSKDVVLRDCIIEMNRIFKRVHENAGKMRECLANKMKESGGPRGNPSFFPPVAVGSPRGGGGGDFPGAGGGAGAIVSDQRKQQQAGMTSGDTEFAQCPQCKKSNMKVKTSKAGSVFIACMGFPDCKTTMSLPKALESINMSEE